MKKLSLILALILSLSFVGCKEDSKKDDDDKKTVSVSDLLSKKDKDDDKDKDKDRDDDKDNDKDDDKDDDDDNDGGKKVEKTPSPSPVKKETSSVVATPKEEQSNGKYKLLKEGNLPNPTFEVLNAGRLVLTSYKVVIPNHDEEKKYILFEGTYTNLDEYDTNLNLFMSYCDFYQNGIRLSGKTFEEKDVYTSVLTNATIDIAVSYELRDDKTPVEFKWGQDLTNRASYMIEI